MDDKEMPEESIISVPPSSAGNVDDIARKDDISPIPFRSVWATASTFTTKVAKFTLLFIAKMLLLPPARWKGVFILSCLAVSFDSLFLYIPIIDEEHKCLGTDMTLRNVALALRSFTDLTFIFHIFYLIKRLVEGPIWYDSNSAAPIEASWLSIKLKNARESGETTTKKISWLSVSVVINFVAILPFPQTYIQSETEKSMKIEEGRRRMLDSKYKEIEKWMLVHGVPDDKKNYYLKNIIEKRVVKQINEEVDTAFIREIYMPYPGDKSDLVDFICINALKKVSLLRYLDEQVLNEFYNGSYYKSYGLHWVMEKDNYITKAGEVLDTLYLIIDGTIEEVQTQRRLDCCGEEVLRWAILNHNKSEEQWDPLPNATVAVKCLTDIRAFYFKANQLIKILKKLKISDREQLLEALALAPHDADRGIKEWLLRSDQFLEDFRAYFKIDVDVVSLFSSLSEQNKPFIKRPLGMKALKKVPMLQKMHEYVLEIICNHLEPVVYEMDSYVVRAGEPLSFMIFILVGKVTTTYTNSSNGATSSLEITEPSNENVLERGGYYGEQLLSWASPNNIYSSDNPVKSERDVKCLTKVEALMLKAEDLKSVASRCGSQWNFNKYCMDSQQLIADGRDDVTSTTPMSTIEETIRLHQGHDTILEQLILIRETIFRRLDDQGRRLDEMAAILAKVGYTGITGTSSISPVPCGFTEILVFQNSFPISRLNCYLL